MKLRFQPASPGIPDRRGKSVIHYDGGKGEA
jgi:hypothetical protein